MKKSKNSILFTMLFVIGMVTYNICLFVLTTRYTAVFWTTYTFTMLAFMLQLFLPYILRYNKQYNKGGFLGLPLFIHSCSYFIIQLIVGIILMRIIIPSKLALVIEIIILAIFLMAALPIMFGTNKISSLDRKTARQKGFANELVFKIQNLVDDTVSSCVSVEMKVLLDAAKHSDPISTASVVPIEQNILSSLAQLQSTISTSSKETSIVQINNIVRLLKERNRSILSSK